mmetsp:Transcript_30976/g.50566  ORF Transcript_30976/g.50566 Transcript_30976/m.50566 type:complete len:293 (-) Transcript_30976:208-1086(-)
MMMCHNHTIFGNRRLCTERLGYAIGIRPRRRLDQGREQCTLSNHGMTNEFRHSPEGGAAVHFHFQPRVLSPQRDCQALQKTCVIGHPVGSFGDLAARHVEYSFGGVGTCLIMSTKDWVVRAYQLDQGLEDVPVAISCQPDRVLVGTCDVKYSHDGIPSRFGIILLHQFQQGLQHQIVPRHLGYMVHISITQVHNRQRATLLRHITPLIMHRPTNIIQQPHLPKHGHTIRLERRKIGQRGNGIEPRRLGHVQAGAGGGAGGEFEAFGLFDLGLVVGVVVHSGEGCDTAAHGTG